MRRRRPGHGRHHRAPQLTLDEGLLRDVLTLGLGVVTGLLSAAFGVGGAVLSTPGIRLLGASAAIAVGTTLPSILPSAVSGTFRYAREEIIDWRVVRWTAPLGVAASVGGSLLSKVIPGEGHALMLLTAGLLLFTSWRMARTPPPDTLAPSADDDREFSEWAQPGHEHRTPLTMATVGATAGLLSGLLGIGGGIVLVPAFTELLRLPIKAAIATSLVCVGIFAVPGTLTHGLLGDIDWRFAVALAVGVVPGARAGASLAMRSGDRRLRAAVAGLLAVVALVYGGSELAALVD